MGLDWTDTYGSSPRARGGLAACSTTRQGRGLIPASAGRTVRARNRCHALRAHPRERGEDLSSMREQALTEGSSPRARGGLLCWLGEWARVGLIPASAGRTIASQNLRRSTTAHPRERGEDDRKVEELHQEMGSSPRARGGRFPAVRRNRSRGLIPASAGRTKRHG